MKYIILGDPIPLSRVRFNKTGRPWDPQKQLKLVWGISLQDQHIGPLLEGPLHMEITFYFEMPKRKKMTSGTPHVFKPDLSNLIKFVEDIAIGIIYHDDCIISSLISKKVYDKIPRTEFIISEIKQ